MDKAHRSESLVVAVVAAALLVGAPPESGLANPVRADSEAVDPLTVRLVYYDLVDLDPRVTVVAWEVVDSIFAEIGVVVEWIDPDALRNGSRNPDERHLKVILTPEPLAIWSLGDGALGHVAVAEFPRDTIFAFESRVRTTLLGGKRKSLGLDHESLGTAFGRVIAHELVHALTPEPFHATSGLMRAAQDRQTLTCQKVTLDERSIAEVRRGLLSAARLSRRCTTLSSAGGVLIPGRPCCSASGCQRTYPVHQA